MKKEEREKIMGEILSDLTVSLADKLEIDFPVAEKLVRSTSVYQTLEHDPNLGMTYNTSAVLDLMLEELPLENVINAAPEIGNEQIIDIQ